MSLAAELACRLDERPSCDGAVVADWGFELAEGEAVRAGLANGALGGPYEPPGVLLGVGGWIDLRWSDGVRTLGTVDRLVLDELEDRLAAWRAAAFRDRWAGPLQGPGAYPEVQTHDPTVEAMVGGDPGALFDLLRGARTALEARDLGQIDAKVGVGTGHRWIRNSAGVGVDFPETSFALQVSAEELYWEVFSKRRAPSADEVRALIEGVARTAAELRRDDRVPRTEVPVLLAPSVLERFLGRFLGTNLGGRAVLDGHSTFSRDDFVTRQPVLREDLDLLVDTTLPLELATSPCSAEGVPGGRVALIASGRLATPMADLKQARRGGFQPTPSPRGYPSLLLETADAPVALEAALAELGPGLVVYFVMGVHTQNARTADYSVVAPQAQVVRGGAMGGKAAVRLGGNFLAQLRDPSSTFVRFPGGYNPGLLVHCDVRATG